ncbi:MAG: type I DNA topoisomerase [Simkaniaceae bacterium]|nr:type I DNA topoisomerase [Simkaniaceae bacterium]
MSKALIIVESPTKIKTLKKFLRGDYKFESSIGHVRDLPVKRFGIDVEGDFEPEYEVLPGKKDVISKLKKSAKECDVVYLAPDPDREGEAIAWHIAELLPKSTKIKRITFNEITREAVQEAIQSPREINHALVNAQQARRLLDRMVGYKISPIISRKVKRGRDGFLSAGRVQSVALKLVVEREEEIDAFKPVEYWQVGAMLKLPDHKRSFQAMVHTVMGKRIEKEKTKGKDVFLIPNEKVAKELAGQLDKATYEVSSIDKKEKKRHPVPPFITSTLQQEASRHYGFSAQRTMSIAQSLYEGVDLGNEGTEGLITYMRTDSVRISPEAQKDGANFIKGHFGAEYLPEKPPRYSTKKSAQDAHEAIRPTHVHHTPEGIKSYLNADQFKLYSLVWKRFVASQMKPAIYDTVACEVETDQDITLRATGSVIKFKGFLVAYEEKADHSDEPHQKDHILPPLKLGQALEHLETLSSQHFTKPPPRFTEASLVKELEKSGIGRPSTYATIMNKIQSRDYTVKENRALKPTELGKVICQMLNTSFGMIMNIGFTATMEDHLDQIAVDDKDWKNYIRSFWKEFAPMVEEASEHAHVPKIDTDKKCPKCGDILQKIWAGGKYFYGCAKYPDCDYTAPIDVFELDKSQYHPDFDWDQKCEKCGKPMTIRSGRYGLFLGCSGYPDCKSIVNIPKKDEMLHDELPDCPAVGCPGKLVQRRSRFGKSFFACSTYPDCDVIGNEIDQVQEKFKDHPRTPYKKKAGGKKGGGGARGKKELSKELTAVVGKGPLTRGEITKKLWEYIKKHDLQDPENKRRIVPDAKLEKVFGSKESVDMMKLAGIISKHVS